MTAFDRAPRDDLGLRERKKLRTRQAIVRAAMDLFAEHGFEGTTIHDIAGAADIAPRTFFGYFPSKEAVVFHDFDEAFELLERRLGERAPRESAFDALRAWVLEWTGERDPATDPDHALRHRLIAEAPALAAHERANFAHFETVLAAAVARDLGVETDSLRAHLAAAAAVAALKAVGRHGGERAEPAGEQAVAVLDEALAFLHGGLEALRRRPAVELPPRGGAAVAQ